MKNKKLLLYFIYILVISFFFLIFYLEYSDFSLLFNDNKRKKVEELNNYKVYIKSLENDINVKTENIIQLLEKNEILNKQIDNINNSVGELNICKKNYIKLHSEMYNLGCITEKNRPLPIVKRTIETVEKLIKQS
jgi:hypothetical protein